MVEKDAALAPGISGQALFGVEKRDRTAGGSFDLRALQPKVVQTFEISFF